MNVHTEQATISQFLQTHFSQFEPELAKKLAQHSILREFESDEQLMRPGQYFKSTMLIVQGGVKLYREDHDGNEFFIYQLGPGNACALSMICATKKEQSQISARAVEPTRAILVPIALMDELMTGYKSWYYFVLETHLMPREWGKEPFYTFMPRERNDAFGNLAAATLNTRFKPEKHIELALSGGYFHLPDVKNFRQNKYGMPGYSQINLGLTYQFDQYLQGLSAFLLVVRKDKMGSTYDDSRYTFNKVNMIHANLIFNYRF